MNAAALAYSHPPEPAHIYVGELLRVSSEEQAEDTRAGLARQKAVNERTLLSRGLTRVMTLELHVSGTVMVDHPQLKNLLDLIKRREIHGVVCADLDRLFRPDNFHSYSILQTFQDYGAKIYTGDSVYDLQTSNGLLQSSIRSAIAGFELSLIRERLHGAKETKRKAGKFPGCWKNLPFGVGYDRKTETWHYTPEIVRVKELFDRFEAGERNYSALGRDLGFCQITTKNLLRNPIYTGWRVIDQKRGEKRVSATGKLYRVKVKRSADDVIRVKVLEGIISEERHAAVLQEMDSTKFNFIERFRSNFLIHLCSGVFRCGVCGNPMYVLSGKQPTCYVACKSNYYINKRKMGGCRQPTLREDQTEAALKQLVQETLMNPERLAAILEASASKFDQTVTPFTDVVNGTSQLEELGRRDKRLLEAYEAGAVSLDELKTKRESLRRQRDALERSIRPARKRESGDLEERARLIVKAAIRFAGCPDRYHQKKIIDELFSEVHIREHHVTGFKLKPGFLAAGRDEVVALPEPLRIGPPPDVVPEGHKRCLKCHLVKPLTDYYDRLNRCRPCISLESKENYAKRKAARSSLVG